LSSMNNSKYLMMIISFGTPSTGSRSYSNRKCGPQFDSAWRHRSRARPVAASSRAPANPRSPPT
jgi:hypothetical protein